MKTTIVEHFNLNFLLNFNLFFLEMIDFFSLSNANDYKITSSISLPGHGDSTEENKSSSSSHMENISYTYNTSDEEMFDALNPYEKLCKLCENPTPSNM